MDTPEFQRLSALFLELRGCDIEDVESALAGLDASEPGVASQLRRMLDADADRTPVDQLVHVFEPYRSAILGQREAPPTKPKQVGRYRLLHQIGSGAHGDVWLADQDEPVRRQVALKMLRRSLAHGLNDERFRRELTALERLTHPGIARLLDAGVADDGTPYLVVEHVAGEPVTDFARQRDLDADQRVALVVAACDAVAHAHRNGIIHRDLKPSNILASERDAGGFGLAIIDFGIAKVLGDHHTQDPAETTRFEGSWAYASPEQRGLINDWADTRSDVFSLGVVLYELLTGETVMTHDSPGGSSRPVTIDDLRRAESLRPSACLLPVLASDRHRIKDELDWVVARCLRVKPGERYPSVESLGAELQRWLDRESVTARPPSFGYALRKHARRRPALVAGSTIAAAGLVAVGVITSFAVIRISAERDRALVAEASEAEARRIAEEIGGFVIDRLDQRNTANRGINTTVAEVFEGTYEVIEEQHADSPRIAIELHRVAGDTLSQYARYEQALRHYERRLELVEVEFGPKSREAVSALSGVSFVLLELGRADASEAIDRRALAVAERVLERDHPSRLIAQERVATHLQRRGKTDEALELQEKAVAGFERSRPGSIDHAKALVQHGQMLVTADHFADARVALARADDIFERRNPNHPDRLKGLNALGRLHLDIDEPDEAVAVYERLVPLVDEFFGRASMPSLVSRSNFASGLTALGRLDAALDVRTAIEAEVDEALGPRDPTRVRLAIPYAELLWSLGRQEQARAMLASIETLCADLRPDNLSTDDLKRIENLQRLVAAD